MMGHMLPCTFVMGRGTGAKVLSQVRPRDYHPKKIKTQTLKKSIGAMWVLIPFLWGGVLELNSLDQVRPRLCPIKKIWTQTLKKSIGAMWALIPFLWGGALEQNLLDKVRPQIFSTKKNQDPNP